MPLCVTLRNNASGTMSGEPAEENKRECGKQKQGKQDPQNLEAKTYKYLLEETHEKKHF